MTTTLSAEEFILKDGNKIVGTLTGVTGDSLKVKTNYGDIQIPKKDVVSINFPENKPAAAEDAPMDIDQVIDGTTYRNRTVGVEMTVPSDWRTNPSLLSRAIQGSIESRDQTQFMFITPEEYDGDLKPYRALIEVSYEKSFSGYEKLEERETTVAGRKAIRLVFQGKPTDGPELTFLVYLVAEKGKVVRVSFGTLRDLFKDSLPTFEKMAASYKPTA